MSLFFMSHLLWMINFSLVEIYSIHSTLLPEQVHPSETFGTFHKFHVPPEVALSRFPEDVGKKKRMLYHPFFIIFINTVILSEDSQPK